MKYKSHNLGSLTDFTPISKYNMRISVYFRQFKEVIYTICNTHSAYITLERRLLSKSGIETIQNIISSLKCWAQFNARASNACLL